MLVQRLFHISIVVLFRAESWLFQPTHTTKKSYKVEGEKLSCKHILQEKKIQGEWWGWKQKSNLPTRKMVGPLSLHFRDEVKKDTYKSSWNVMLQKCISPFRSFIYKSGQNNQQTENLSEQTVI